MSKTIYFLSSGVIPLKDGGGGSVVIYRHLVALQQEGFRIIFVNCNPNAKIKSQFTQIDIPNRIWHPPLRKYSPSLTTLKFAMMYAYLKKKVKFKTGDKIFSLLEDQGSLLAYKIHKYTKIPYYLFFHDDNVFSAYFKDHIFQASHLKKIIRACTHFFAVSEPMKELLIANGAKEVSVLYPIPEGISLQKDPRLVNFNALSFCYAGMILPFHDQLFKKIYFAAEKEDAKLVLISNSDALLKQRFIDCENLVVSDRKETLTELFNYFNTNIDVLLLFYSANLNEEIRASHSFPSKFTEFCHLGIPILIIAPVESAIGKWAIANSWLAFLSTQDQQAIENMMLKFKEPSFWQACSAQCQLLANGEFNPKKIHSQLMASLHE